MNKVLCFIVITFSSLCFTHNSYGKNTPSKIVHKQVLKGDSLNKILLQTQFPQKAINQILSRNKYLKHLSLSPKQVYTVDSNKQKRTLSIYQEHSQKLLFWYNPTNKQTGVNRVNDQLTTKLQSFNGKIKGSLYSSIVKLVKNPLIPYKFQDIFILYYDLKKKLQPGAQFSFIIEKKFAGDKFIKYGAIAEAELVIDNKFIRRVLIKNGKTYSYIGKEDDSKRPFYSPVDYQHFSSLYKKRRFHPVKKRYMAHQGIDFALPEGRTVYSVANGKVTKTGYNKRAGHYLSLIHI